MAITPDKSGYEHALLVVTPDMGTAVAALADGQWRNIATLMIDAGYRLGPYDFSPSDLAEAFLTRAPELEVQMSVAAETYPFRVRLRSVLS